MTDYYSPMTATMPNYPTTFRAYILGTVRYALAQVQATPNLLPDAVRQQALHALSYALDLPEAWPLTRDLLLAMAPKMEQAGHREDWMPYLERGLNRSQEISDIPAMANLHLQLGMLWQFLSKFDIACNHLHASATSFANLNDVSNHAKVLNRLGYIARLQRQYQEAKAYVEQALRLLTSEDLGRQFCYFVLGTIALDEGAWERAVQNFRHSLTLCEKMHDQRLIALRLGNLGLALYEQGNYTDAIDCCEQSIALFEVVQDPVQQAIIRMNLGNIYLLKQELKKALELYVIAEVVLKVAQDEFHLALVIMNQGIVWCCLHHWEQAEQLFLDALERWRRLSNVRWEVNTMEELGQCYFDQGLYKEASAIFQKALIQLQLIRNEPGYDPLYQSIIRRLNDVNVKVGQFFYRSEILNASDFRPVTC